MNRPDIIVIAGSSGGGRSGSSGRSGNGSSSCRRMSRSSGLTFVHGPMRRNPHFSIVQNIKMKKEKTKWTWEKLKTKVDVQKSLPPPSLPQFCDFRCFEGGFFALLHFHGESCVCSTFLSSSFSPAYDGTKKIPQSSQQNTHNDPFFCGIGLVGFVRLCGYRQSKKTREKTYVPFLVRIRCSRFGRSSTFRSTCHDHWLTDWLAVVFFISLYWWWWFGPVLYFVLYRTWIKRFGCGSNECGDGNVGKSPGWWSGGLESIQKCSGFPLYVSLCPKSGLLRRWKALPPLCLFPTFYLLKQ